MNEYCQATSTHGRESYCKSSPEAYQQVGVFTSSDKYHSQWTISYRGHYNEKFGPPSKWLNTTSELFVSLHCFGFSMKNMVKFIPST